MKELKEVSDKLYFEILSLQNAIKIQENNLARWSHNENYPNVLKDYRDIMIGNMEKLEGLKIAYKAVITELIKEICE